MIRKPIQSVRQTISSAGCNRKYGQKLSCSEKARLLHDERRASPVTSKKQYPQKDFRTKENETFSSIQIGRNRFLSTSQHLANNGKGKAISSNKLFRITQFRWLQIIPLP